MENAWVASQHERLASSMSIACTMTTLYVASHLVFVLLNGWSTGGGVFDTATRSEPVTAYLAQMIVACCVGLISLVAAQWPKFRSMLGLVGFEIWVSAVMVMFITMQISMNPWFLARLFGGDPASSVKDTRQDAGILLHMDLIITVSHLLFPARWIVLVPTEVAPTLLYAGACFAIGSSATLKAVAVNIILITVLTFAAGLGRRQMEYHQRIAFAQFVHEKTQRVQIEHRLARIQEAAESHPPKDDELVSDLTSAATGKLFSNVERADSEQAIGHLQELAQLGYKEHWLVPLIDLRVLPGEMLGMGGFGMVIRAEYHGAPVVLKFSKRPCSVLLNSGSASMAQELRIFRRLRHPNLVLFLGACIAPGRAELILVLECVHGKPLDTFVAPPPSDPSTRDRFSVADGVACGLTYLHAQHPQIVHGDLKGPNVLVEKCEGAVKAKIIDFGLSRLITRHVKPMGGTFAWMAPEVVMDTEHNVAPSADVFSYGRLLYMTMTGHEPLAGVPLEELLATMRQGHPHPMQWDEQVPLWMQLQRLCEACTQVEPSQRPSIERIRNLLRELSNGESCSGATICIEDAIADARASVRDPGTEQVEDSLQVNADMHGCTAFSHSSSETCLQTFIATKSASSRHSSSSAANMSSASSHNERRSKRSAHSSTRSSSPCHLDDFAPTPSLDGTVLGRIAL
eukprot:CAMPEP_0115182346 /NCGR_PEP_ID=MMETSP0270-20121206/7898_1 /TAXON_ID=71861 /ORGANISM="Scrippsiella trochoidea, Strain CCMP3099" /LENGTH=684 /DNA_ID=CAMNT_0002595395 /DNA_START=61 /DNA_END=2115 /DNA_ORIENTATION=+